MEHGSRGTVLIVVGAVGLLRSFQLIGEATAHMSMWNITFTTVILLWGVTDRLESRRSFARYGRAWTRIRHQDRSIGD